MQTNKKDGWNLKLFCTSKPARALDVYNLMEFSFSKIAYRF